MDFRLSLPKFKPWTGFAQQFQKRGCGAARLPIVHSEAGFIGEECAYCQLRNSTDSSRNQAALRNDNPFWGRHHYQNVIRVLVGAYSSLSNSRPEKALAAASIFFVGFSRFGQAQSNGFFQAQFPFFPAYWFENAVVWHAQSLVPNIRQQLLHFMFQISRER
jgi:hypothetical protein